MRNRYKEGSTPPSRPSPPSIPAAMIGISLSGWAVSAMTLGASLAIGKAITGKG